MFLSQNNDSNNKDLVRNLLEVMDMFMSQTVVMVSEMRTCHQTHQCVYIEYVQLLYINQISITGFKQT